MFKTIGYFICIPFAWLTRLFYSLTGSYGVALFLFTLVVKLVMLPFQLKSKKSMLRMNRLQGKVKEIQRRYANNKERQQQEVADLYAKEGINPMSGCLWTFIPFPIMIALYYIIRVPLRYFMNLSVETIEELTSFAKTLGYAAPTESRQAAYEQIYLTKFVHENWSQFADKFDGLIDLDYNFIGLDLANTCSNVFKNLKASGWGGWGLLLLLVLSAGLQFLLSIITMKQQDTSSMNGSNKAMIYMMPLMTLWLGYMLPAALCVYWIANSLFSCVQELFLGKYFNKVLDREETEREREKREKRYAKITAARESRYKQLEEQEAERIAQQQVLRTQQKKQQQFMQQQNRKLAGTNENGRIGQRPYARGRSYSEDHYKD